MGAGEVEGEVAVVYESIADGEGQLEMKHLGNSAFCSVAIANRINFRLLLP